MKAFIVLCAVLALSSALFAGNRRNVHFNDDGSLVIQTKNDHHRHHLSQDNQDRLAHNAAKQTLTDREHQDQTVTGVSQTVAEVAAEHSFDQVERDGHNPTSHFAQTLAVHTAQEALDEADRIDFTSGPSEHAQQVQVAAVLAAKHALELHNLKHHQQTESTFVEALAVAAAQQAIDEHLHSIEGKHEVDPRSETVQKIAFEAATEAIEKAQMEHAHGIESTVVQAIAVDAANRALHHVQHRGYDVSSKAVRALGVAAAQQALDLELTKGQDVTSDVARVIAVAAARDALVHASENREQHLQVLEQVGHHQAAFMRPHYGHELWQEEQQNQESVQGYRAHYMASPRTSYQHVFGLTGVYRPSTHQTWFGDDQTTGSWARQQPTFHDKIAAQVLAEQLIQRFGVDGVHEILGKHFEQSTGPYSRVY